MTGINSLPKEILLKIFTYYVETEIQFDFIYKISCVCPQWEEVCMDRSLWRKFDGTLPLRVLIELCKQGYLTNVEVLKFSNCYRSLSKEEQRSIYGNLPRLKSINFSNANRNFSREDFFVEVMDHCPDLSEIILLEKYSAHSYRIDSETMKDFLKIRGSKLTSLDFSNTSISHLTELFLTIAASCPNLEKLRARNMWKSKGYFPIVSMQKGLKKLKVLELDIAVKTRIETSESTDGFPSLETFTYKCKSHPHLKIMRFNKLLINSPHLRVLDIRGCTRVPLFILCSLPAEHLERLYVSDTDLYEREEFIQVLKKWGHSLVLLDVSKMKWNDINRLFSRLFSLDYLQNLEVLDLNNTEVTIPTVKLIVEHCRKLNYLDLELCYAIGCEFRRKYRGQIEIRKLLDLDVDDDPFPSFLFRPLQF